MADYSALYRLAPFDVSAPRADFFTPLSRIANQISQNRESAQQQALREQTLADARAARADAAARAERELQFRQQESGRAQSNADRAYGLESQRLELSRDAQRRADELARKPGYQIIEDSAGNKRIIRTSPTGEPPADVTPDMSGGNQLGNPYYTGKTTETQNKDALYARRMIEAELDLSNPNVSAAAMDRVQRGYAGTPFIGNSLVSPEYQQYDQAQRNFINATLRRESGAAISPSEFDNANRQYFPQPGDKPAVLAQKAKNRRAAIESFASGAGPSFRPSHVFDESGVLVPYVARAGGGHSAKSSSSGKISNGLEWSVE